MKKAILASALAALMLLSACGAPAGQSPAPSDGNVAPPAASESDFDIIEYKSLVSACNEAIMAEAILLSNVGKWENNYWEALGSVSGEMDYENMVSKAMDWLSEKSDATQDTLSENYTAICAEHDEIAGAGATGSEAEEIAVSVAALFEAYNSLYLLVTAPSGEIADFVKNFNDYSDAIVNNNSLLETLAKT